MTWTLETKVTDRAPLKRGDEWTQDVCYIIRDERGRYVISATEQNYPSLAGVMLSREELQAAVRLIVAAPALRDALEGALAQLVHDWWKIDAEWGPSGEKPDSDPVIAEARAALAKARGEA